MSFQSWLESVWYRDAAPPVLLRPLSALFGYLSRRRRARLSVIAEKPGCPVIVVGNVTVGGTGKTPFVIWLVERLGEWGFRPGVISRGYGGQAAQYPCRVGADSMASEVGDEPLMIARRTGVPVMVGADRLRSAKALLETTGVDIIVSDDGLQHYRLARDLEICVVDGARGFGNGALLPAGPLREGVSRVEEVGLLVVNGTGGTSLLPPHTGRIDVQLRPARQLRAVSGGPDLALDALAGQQVHAVAGIGHPARFFDTLESAGLRVLRHPFPDHHRFGPRDLCFDDPLHVIMTEKDAVKCTGMTRPHTYYLPVKLEIGETDAALVQQCCSRLAR